jgi:nucleoside-triphosphatase THEP1
MIEIKITRDGKKIEATGNIDIIATRKYAIAEFVGVMHVLKKSNKEIFRDALHHIVDEDICEMIDEFGELEDGGRT